MNGHLRWLTALLMATMLFAAACGGDGDSGGSDTVDTPSSTNLPGTTTAPNATDDATATDTSQTATEPSGTNSLATATAEPEDTGDAAGDIEPCELLTREEVETVLPDTDDGSVVMAGGSLMEGVDAFQCSYVNPTFDLLTVIINVASTADDFEWIEPDPDNFGSDARVLEIADGAWLRGDEGDIKITAVKGWAVIDLELMATGADERSEALIDLARLVVERIE